VGIRRLIISKLAAGGLAVVLLAGAAPSQAGTAWAGTAKAGPAVSRTTGCLEWPSQGFRQCGRNLSRACRARVDNLVRQVRAHRHAAERPSKAVVQRVRQLVEECCPKAAKAAKAAQAAQAAQAAAQAAEAAEAAEAAQAAEADQAGRSVRPAASGHRA
jgi:hypothetical protein